MQVEPLRAEYQDRDARVAVDRRAGPRRACCCSRRSAAASRRRCSDDIPATMASLSAFNRWLEDDWGFSYQDRLIAAPMLSLADPDAARRRGRLADRARRAHRARPPRAGARRRTARAASLGDKLHDPVWARLAEASVPVAFHLGDSGYNALRRRVGRQRHVRLRQQRPARPRPRRPTGPIHDTIASLIVHGVFNRHPTLRVASIENGSDWLAPAREAAAQAGEPDAVGLRRGSARHDPPARVGHAVLRGGPRARWPS